MCIPEETDSKILEIFQPIPGPLLRRFPTKWEVLKLLSTTESRKIEQEDLIEKYAIKLNLESFENASFTSVIQVRSNSGEYVLEVSEMLKKMSHMHAFYNITGDYDLVDHPIFQPQGIIQFHSRTVSHRTPDPHQQ